MSAFICLLTFSRKYSLCNSFIVTKDFFLVQVRAFKKKEKKKRIQQLLTIYLMHTYQIKRFYLQLMKLFHILYGCYLCILISKRVSIHAH